MAQANLKTLFTQGLEAFQILSSNDKTYIISAMDDLEIGQGTDVGVGDNTTEVMIWAENIVLSNKFSMKNGLISAHTIQVNEVGTLSVNGIDGQTPSTIHTDRSKPPKNGDNGNQAGILQVYLDRDVSAVKFSAHGGNGGNGQVGTIATSGGKGGDAGAGGTIQIIFGSVALVLLQQIQAAAKISQFTDSKEEINKILTNQSNLLSKERFSGIKKYLQKAKDAKNKKDFDEYLGNAARSLQAMVDEEKANIKQRSDTSAGNYGVYGEGTPNGENGAKADNGKLQIFSFGDSKELYQLDFSPFSPFLWAHPSQLQRLLYRAQLQYLVLDPINNPTGVEDLIQLLLRVISRSQPFFYLNDESELGKQIESMSLSMGEPSILNAFSAVYNKANLLFSQLQKGLDVFGFDSTTVPLGSFNFYKNILQTILSNFQTIEEYYLSYYKAVAQETANTQQLVDTRTQGEQIKEQYKNEISQLTPLALSIANIVQSYEVILPELRKNIDDAIKGLTNEIETSFSFDFNSVFQALTTLAFAPESKFMILTQSGQFLYDGLTKITNDQGVPVEKSYLVSQVKTISGSIRDLLDGYETLRNGDLQPQDPGAGKLVALESDIDKISSEFYNQFSVSLDKLKKVMQEYLGKIAQRNQQILTYNTIIDLLIQKGEALFDLEKRLSVLNAQILNQLRPNAPGLLTFLSNLYYQGREQILYILDQTSRAYRFWALDNRNLLSEAIDSRNPPDINYSVLSNAQNTILRAYQQAIENFGTSASALPLNPKDTGIEVKLDDTQIEIIKTTGRAAISITAVTPSTTIQDNPFAKKANIRIKEVRTWIKGAKTGSKNLTVHITHTGSEKIVNQDGLEFNFTHNPIKKPFIYNQDTLNIVTSVNFGPEQEIHDYAAVGPFTQWIIEASKDDNSDLDLLNVTEVIIDFHITFYDFKC